jgi:hypothetical protein
MREGGIGGQHGCRPGAAGAQVVHVDGCADAADRPSAGFHVFIEVCAYFPYPAKVWANGHEWVKRQAERAGPGFTALSNGFASRDDPAALQVICDRLQSGTTEVFTQLWLHRLPLPLTPADQDAGYWWETSMRQVEISRTIVFDAPRHARGFFEALVADNLEIGRPPTWRSSSPARPPRHQGSLPHRDRPPRQRRRPGECVLDAERAGQGTVLASPAFERIAHPPSTRRGGGPRLFDSAILGSWP